MDDRTRWRYSCYVIRFFSLAAALTLVIAAFGSPFANVANAADSLWLDSQGLTPRGDALLKTIRAAGDHGLEPAWYGVAAIDKALAQPDGHERADRLMTEAFVSYASDVSTGRVRANRVDPNISIDQRKVDRADLLKAAADSTDFAGWLAALPPRTAEYAALQKALAAWRAKRATATFTELPDGAALKPGMIDERVPVLRKRLVELDLTVPEAGAVADLYDEPLVAVVKGYQDTKGLTVDGVIGTKTRMSLNTTLDERIEQIVVNLDRRRWLRDDLGSRYVLVNTGNYSMVFVDGGKPVFQSLVIVGTPKDPTPEISSVMRGFQTNPYWTVPSSIAGEEYLPMLRRDPNVLAASGFRLFSSWSEDDELDPNSVDWNSIQPKAFPYRIRQEPGAGNALGYIFFPFANNYGIYMHDTASRWLFTEGSRNFSHGCIRLQNPLDFVELVYGGRNGFSKERVRAAIANNEQNHYTFPAPVNLRVTYQTVTANADGTVTFRDDVYGRDRRVARAMAPRT
jgi:L,D-transpeptidase YcbB